MTGCGCTFIVLLMLFALLAILGRGQALPRALEGLRNWLGELAQSSEPFEKAVATCRDDPHLVERLGPPLEAESPTQFHFHRTPQTGDAELEFRLRGSRESAVVKAHAIWKPGGWQLDRLLVRFADGTTRELMDEQ